MSQASYPMRRAADLDLRVVGSELLAYDLRTEQLTHLDERSAAVWNALDGRSDAAQLAITTKLSVHEVANALLGLKESNLLDGGMSRRQMLRLGATASAAGGMVLLMATPALAACVSTTAPSLTANPVAGFPGCPTNNKRAVDLLVSGFSAGVVTVTAAGTSGVQRASGTGSVTVTADCAATVGQMSITIKRAQDVIFTATQGAMTATMTATAVETC